MSILTRLLAGLNLRFPALFAFFAVLTLLDLVLPDPIPFVDELGLALLTLMFGVWHQRRAPKSGATGASPRPQPVEG